MGVSKKVKKLKVLLAHSRHKYFKIALVGSVFFSWVVISLSLYPIISGNGKSGQNLLAERILGASTMAQKALISPVVEITLAPSTTPIPTNTPTPVPTIIPTKTQRRISTPTSSPSINPSQYTAEKLNDVTWRVKDVANDDKMASANDIVNALNSYRGERGMPSLSVDSNLSSYAQERANLFSGNGSLDSHAGFQNYMDNGGFDKAGFNSLGENSAYLSGPMNADKIVRSIFGADGSHDGNQLDNWTHVGVGVNGNAINVNFGKNKK